MGIEREIGLYMIRIGKYSLGVGIGLYSIGRVE